MVNSHYLFRIPKKIETAVLWKSAIGSKANNFDGLICIKHFEPESLKHNRSKNRMELKPNSIPSLFNTEQNNQTTPTASTVIEAARDESVENVDHLENADDVTDVTSVLDHCNGSAPFSSFTSTTAEKYCSDHIVTTKPIDKVVDQQMWCTDCMLKDEINEQKNIEIKRLRKKLKDHQKKNWYLESIKRKLDAALMDLKNRTLIDQEQRDILEVRSRSSFANIRDFHHYSSKYLEIGSKNREN